MKLTADDMKLLKMMAKDTDSKFFANHGAHEISCILLKIDAEPHLDRNVWGLLGQIVFNSINSCAQLQGKAQNTIDKLLGTVNDKKRGGMFYFVVHRFCSNNVALACALSQPEKVSLLVKVVNTMGMLNRNKGAVDMLGQFEKKLDSRQGALLKLTPEARASIANALKPAIGRSRQEMLTKMKLQPKGEAIRLNCQHVQKVI